jgi:hypothetical protein
MTTINVNKFIMGLTNYQAGENYFSGKNNSHPPVAVALRGF